MTLLQEAQRNAKTNAKDNVQSNVQSNKPHTVADVQNASAALLEQYQRVRQQSLAIVNPLPENDLYIQSMADASPLRWHLAHTSWFFEAFILQYCRGYTAFDTTYDYLFNSYYNGIGKQFPRAQRGTQTRPSVAQIRDYRNHVDDAIVTLLQTQPDAFNEPIILGLHHEQQHQELMLTDIKHALSLNPLQPVYCEPSNGTPALLDPTENRANENSWLSIPEGLYHVGQNPQTGLQGFSFDNEQPQHPYYLQDYRIAARTVTNGEYLDFINDGGYRNPALWLSDGWQWVQQHDICHPLYWHDTDAGWHTFTLRGDQPLDLKAPVTHISFYEANAYAAWLGKRLPTEFEWEVAAQQCLSPESNVLEAAQFHPIAPGNGHHFIGNVWEWTGSAYSPYPGFKPFAGNAGEYNGKFMCNQMVLKGGSCVTPHTHIRTSYRNFFYPQQRWQFTGIRLAD